jgi:hypothetical protein
MENSSPPGSLTNDQRTTQFVPDQVKVVDQKYLSQKFVAKSERDQQSIDNIVKQFNLRPAQEHAFRIIANHAAEPGSGQLKMYLGGMACTGKSQVIKALTYFFNNQNESHRFQLTALTGSAAALLLGGPPITLCRD